jgi:cyclic pyranopterin phosphate synthase
MQEAKAVGATEVVITGGEPTIRPDIFDIIRYANFLGFKPIELQTNGRMFSYEPFTRKMIGIATVLYVVAIHSHRPEVHDYLTRSPKSWDQTVQGIRNLKKYGQNVTAMTVVTKPNYKHLTSIVEFLASLNVNQIQLAIAHPWGNARKYFDEIVPSLSSIKDYIHKSIDLANKLCIKLVVEAYPFCFMRGYEKHCSEQYLPKRIEVREITSYEKDFKGLRKETFKAKSKKCKLCKYDIICEGPWKEYPQKFGWAEINPVIK